MIYGLPLWNWFVFFFVYVPIVILWITTLIDMFSRPDISGLGKAGWSLSIFILPLIGALTYLALRPSELEIYRERQERESHRRAA